LTAVVGPDVQMGCKEFSTRAALEGACLEEASRRFTQANNTPIHYSRFLAKSGLTWAKNHQIPFGQGTCYLGNKCIVKDFWNEL